MYLTWVGVVTLILCGWSSAQQIRVNLDDAPFVNKILTLTVPRVSQIVFESNSEFAHIATGNVECNERNEKICTLELRSSPMLNTYILSLDLRTNASATVPQEERQVTVNVHIQGDYEVGCSNHQFPAQLNLVDKTGSLICVPVFVNSSQNASAVTWYQSSSLSGENATRIDYSRVNSRESGGVVNASLIFNTAMKRDAAYYFPVTDTVSDLSKIAPILVTYQPIITSPFAEFSVDLYIDPTVPVNHTFGCEVESFPEARMIWRYKSTSPDTPNCTLASTTDSCSSPTNIAVERRPSGAAVEYLLHIMNVDYANSGIYSCFPENDAFLLDLVNGINAHSYRLRVKDHLRPLWPAVGIIGVFIVMALFIIFSALWDRFYPKGPRADKLFKTDSHGRPFSVVSSSSGSPDVVGAQLGDGHLHLRRISSARVQLLEETGNN